jgi:hypothetical protein
MDALATALHQLAELSLDRMAETGVPTKLTNQIETKADGRIRIISVLSDDFHRAELMQVSVMLETPELAALLTATADAVEGDAQARELLPEPLRGSPTTPEKVYWAATHVVAPFLMHLSEHHGGIWYKESWFRATYASLRAYLDGKKWPAVLVAPLDNFSTDLDELELGSQVRLVRLTAEEKQELWELHGGMPGTAVGAMPTHLLGWSHALQVPISLSKSDRPVSGTARRAIDEVVSVFRLYRSNWVGVTAFSMTPQQSKVFDPFHDPLPFDPDEVENRLPIFLPERPISPGPKYELDARDATQLSDLFDRYMVRAPDSAFNIAMRRFNLGYLRQSDEDRLIDYWVALEALFASDSTQELRYRASLRIARFVSASPEERSELFQGLKVSYDLRSNVVHGGDPRAKLRRQLPEAILRTEETLRRALRLWVDPTRSHRLDDIDAGLLA